MKNMLVLLSVLLMSSVSVSQEKKEEKKEEKKMETAKATENPKVVLETTEGNITVELYQDKAPESVKNFLKYVDDGFYTDTIFHRVIDGFMVQGGGFTADMKQKPTRPAIKLESGNGLKNERGTLAMARTADPDTATAQFYINVTNNSFLNKDQAQDGHGYAVFGKVVDAKGLEVVDKIKKTKTTNKNGMPDVPEKPIKILKAKRM